MTEQEARSILGLPGRHSSAAVDAAYHEKLNEWSTRHRLAMSLADKQQAGDMLGKLKDARSTLLSGGRPSAVPTRQRPSRPAAQRRRPSSSRRPPPVRTSVRSAWPSPALQAAPTPSATQPVAAQLPQILAALRRRPVPRWAKGVLAAIVGIMLVDMAARLSNIHSANAGRQKPAATRRKARYDEKRGLSVTPKAPRANSHATNSSPARRRAGATVTPAPDRKGFLIVNTFPAAEILLGGKSVGFSPFRVGEKLALAEGTHQLELRSRRYGAFATEVRITAGETRELRYWFDTRSVEVLVRSQ